jgi:hypothetical protein
VIKDYRSRALSLILRALTHICTSQVPTNRVRVTVENADIEQKYKEWESIMRLFAFEGKTNSTTITKLVDKIGDENKLIVIDLSGEEVKNFFWNETIKYMVIGQLLSLVGRKTEQKYKEGGLLNSLVVIDEAHRLAPRDTSENEDMEAVKNYLTRAPRPIYISVRHFFQEKLILYRVEEIFGSK